MSVIGKNIKKYRELKGFTQKQLVEMISERKGDKVSKNVVSNWENGLNKPDADTIEILLDIFDIDANTLLGWNNPQQIKDDTEENVDELLSDPAIKDIIASLKKLSKDDIRLTKSFVNRLLGKDE